MKIKDSKWEMTEDAVGMRPKFRVWCWDCVANFFFNWLDVLQGDIEGTIRETLHRMNHGEFDMVLRETFCSPLPAIGDKAYHNDMHYKCAKSDGCDAVKVFGVPIDREYYTELLARRGGKQRIQPKEQWDTNEDLKTQLKGLGYL